MVLGYVTLNNFSATVDRHNIYDYDLLLVFLATTLVITLPRYVPNLQKIVSVSWETIFCDT